MFPVHSRDEVVASVQATFPISSWARALELLDGYGADPHERARERVQLAILKLSAGSEEKMREYVAVAKRDYRDVLFGRNIPKNRDWTRERSAKGREKYSRNSGSNRRAIFDLTDCAKSKRRGGPR